MTNDEALQIARECNIWADKALDKSILAFARRIESAAYERAASECESVAEQVTYQRNSQDAADKCASAIRALLPLPASSGPEQTKCDCYMKGPAKNMEQQCATFDESPTVRVSWCRLCGHQKGCPFHHPTQCKTCDGSKRLWQQFDVGCGSWIDCPDCAKDRAEASKCRCGDGGEICKRAFTGGLQGMTDVCINALNDGTICGHAEACHTPAPAAKEVNNGR